MSNYTEILLKNCEKNTELTIEEIVNKWEEIGFMEGFPEINKETLAINFENMLNYLTHDNDENTDGTFETIVFPMIRKITSEVPIIFDCRMLTKYILNAKIKDIIIYLGDDMKKIAETYSDGEKAFNMLDYNGEQKNIDMEAEFCASLSNYLIDKLK